MQDKHKPKNSVVSNLSIPLCILTLLWLGSSMVSCTVISPSSIGRNVSGSGSSNGIGSGSNKAYAMEEDEGDGSSTPVPQAQDDAYKPSLVTISFDSSREQVTLMPTDEEGQTTAIGTKATISVENSGGYSIYVSSHTSNLVGRSDKNNVIPSITQASTLANLPVNTWGYYAGEGTTVPEGAEYKAMPIAINTGTPIYSNLANQIRQETRNIVLSFAARINKYVKADVYENEVTLSVVSNPRKVAGFNDIETMQELTPSICKAAMENEMAYLKDSRDGNYYWVTKLADGNCWMSQNLALDLEKGVPVEASIINEDGSMGVFSYVPEATTITNHQYIGEINGVSLTNNAKAYHSWDEGKYVVIQPGTAHNGLLFGMPQSLGGINGYTNPQTILEESSKDNLSKNHTENLKTSSILTEYGIVKNVENTANWKISTDTDFTKKDNYINSNGEIASKIAGWSIACENSECTKGVYDAHYLIGNYYQWLAATAQAGTDDTATSTNDTTATTSICPAGWQLPIAGTTNNTVNGSFYNLLKKYGLTSAITNAAGYNIGSTPLYFSRAGYLNIASDRPQIRAVGAYSLNWSSVISTATSAYRLYITNIGIAASDTGSYITGTSLRCLVLSNPS